MIYALTSAQALLKIYPHQIQKIKPYFIIACYTSCILSLAFKYPLIYTYLLLISYFILKYSWKLICFIFSVGTEPLIYYPIVVYQRITSLIMLPTFSLWCLYKASKYYLKNTILPLTQKYLNSLKCFLKGKHFKHFNQNSKS